MPREVVFSPFIVYYYDMNIERKGDNQEADSESIRIKILQIKQRLRSGNMSANTGFNLSLELESLEKKLKELGGKQRP